MWSLYIIMAVLTAVAALKIITPLMPKNKKLGYLLMFLIPVSALCLYLLLGHPELS
jgi:hypothetical protein